jgi:phage gp29-like protein
MPGIYVSPNKYIDFAETPATADLSREIASRGAAWDFYGLIGLLPDPDPVLLKRGDGAEILDGLTADGHVISVIQTRKLGTLKKEFRWQPGALGDKEPDQAAKKLCADLVEDLGQVDVYNLLSEILDAPCFGLTPIEIGWESGDGGIRISKLRGLPHRWFGFTEENEPRFISKNNPWEGEELPAGKFVFARHFPTYDNPFGLRLLSRCFWPVMFKKGGWKFWIKFVEKYATPFLLGRYRQGASPAEQAELLAKLSSMVQDAVAAVPEGSTVELLGAGDKAGSSDLYLRFNGAMDAEISKVIMGQTLTAEVGDTGSYAAAKTHENVLEVYREADQQLAKTTMDEIGKTYGAIRAPGVPAPTFSWFEEEEPRKDFADRDKTLADSGVKFKKPYYVRRYGLKEDEFEISDGGLRNADLTATAKGKSGEFAEDNPLSAIQDPQSLDDLLEDKLAAEADPEIDAMVAKVRELVMSAGSLEAIRDGLIGLYPQISDDQLAQALSLGLTGADLAGRLDIREDMHGQ